MKTFWRRHRHDELVARWADVVGPERLTVIVVDESDHDRLLRLFESMLGLRVGTLVGERGLANRSMTLPEIEAVRAFNVAFRQARLPRDTHARIIRFGAATHMKRQEPSPAWPRIELPQWAVDRAAEISREMVAAIAASGVRIIGDLDSLTRVEPSPLAGDTQPEVAIPPEVAANMAMGVLIASGLARRTVDGSVQPGTSGQTWFEPVEVARIPTYQLAGVVALRGREAIRRRLRRLVGRRGR